MSDQHRSDDHRADPALLGDLEAISRLHPDRVLRLRGTLTAEQGLEAFELLVFRGFSSSTTHPTCFDPDQPVLPHGLEISAAELFRAPLNVESEVCLTTDLPATAYRDSLVWRGADQG